MTKDEYIAAKEAEIDQLAPYEKAIRAVIAQSRMSDALYRMLGETAKAYRDAGLTPDDIRTLWATNSGSFWKAHTVGGSKPNSGKPWLSNVSSELSRAVEFLGSRLNPEQTDAVALLLRVKARTMQPHELNRPELNGAGKLALMVAKRNKGLPWLDNATPEAIRAAVAGVQS